MTEQINFELVSPEEKLVTQPVMMAVIPGEEGELGVGSGHASFVVKLKAGVVKLYEEGQDDPRRIFIGGGFADVTNENCVVLAEEAVDVADLDQSALQQQLENLEEDLGIAEEEVDKARIRGQISLAKARLEAVTGQVFTG